VKHAISRTSRSPEIPHTTMSVAEIAARFDPQLRLNLASCPAPPPPQRPATYPPPTHAALVDAARANTCVRAFIGDQVPTWTDSQVEKNPPCCLVYEHGEVVGSIDDLPMMMRHAEKRRGMGRVVGLRVLLPDEEVLPYNIGLRRGPSHPRRRRYEQRMALRSLLARRDRSAVRNAMRRNLRDFLTWGASIPGLGFRIADATGLSLREFWRAVRGRAA
jgi:hypothetical protein